MIILFFGYCLIACYVIWNIKCTYRKYHVTYKGEVWTVRDKKGRFVTCSSNWWDLAKVGL